jgi:hypothetical protein
VTIPWSENEKGQLNQIMPEIGKPVEIGVKTDQKSEKCKNCPQTLKNSNCSLNIL